MPYNFNQPNGQRLTPVELRSRLPNELLDFFSNIQQEGVFGEGGGGRIANQAFGAATRSGAGRGLRRRVSRRLGPRSGAADSVVANQVYAPAFGGLSQMIAQLNAQNQQSKLQGAGGIGEILKFLEDRHNFSQQISAQDSGGGFLDFLGPIASIIPGIGPAVNAISGLFGGGGSGGSGTPNRPRGSV